MIAVDRWEVVYGDGSRFTSEQGRFADAPPLGVFGIVYYLVDGARLVQMEQHDHSRYRWPDGLLPPDRYGTFEVTEAAGSTVKLGLWVANERYFALFDLLHGREVTP